MSDPSSSSPSSGSSDPQNDNAHPSIQLYDWLQAVRFDCDQAMLGDASIVLKGSVTLSCQTFPLADDRIPGGFDVLIDTNEKGMPVGLTVSWEPSAIVLATQEARAAVLKGLLQAAGNNAAAAHLAQHPTDAAGALQAAVTAMGGVL